MVPTSDGGRTINLRRGEARLSVEVRGAMVVTSAVFVPVAVQCHARMAGGSSI